MHTYVIVYSIFFKARPETMRDAKQTVQSQAPSMARVAPLERQA